MEDADNDFPMGGSEDESSGLDTDSETESNVSDTDDNADTSDMETDNSDDDASETDAESEALPDIDSLTLTQDEKEVQSKARGHQNPFQIFLIDTERLDLAIGKSKKPMDKNHDKTAPPSIITNDSRIKFMINSYNSKNYPRPKIKSHDRKRAHDLSGQKDIRDCFSPSPSKKKPQQDQTQVTPPNDQAPNNQNSVSPSSSSSLAQSKKKSSHDYELSEYQLEFTSPDYDLILYTQSRPDTDLETGMSIMILSKIRFLIRKNSSEIFALPSKYGRWVVQKWADTDFPISVASAILRTGSTVGKRTKSFFSNRFYTHVMMLKGEALDQDQEYSFNPQIFTSFTAIVDSSSIRNILNIQNENVTLKCETGFDSLCFKAKADLTTYAKLCWELSKIYTESSPPSSGEYSQYFTQVNSDMSTHLDKCVLKELKKSVFRDTFFRSQMEERWEKSRIRDFLVCHKDTQSYLNAESVWLSRGPPKRRIESKILNECPSLLELCQLIKSFREKIEETSRCPKAEPFLKSLRLHFSSNCDEKADTNSRFLSCLEGHYVERESKKQFWKLGGRWYSLSYRYTHDIHLKLNELFKEALIQDNSSHLYVPWPKVLANGVERFFKEVDYNQLYAKDENFLIGDNTAVRHGLEFFDLMQFVPENAGKGSRIFLYHIKKCFNSDSMRIVDSQIAQAAVAMQNYETIKLLHQYFINSSTTNLNNFIKVHFQDLEVFKMECQRATFVLGLLHNTPGMCLESDYIYNVQITLQDLINIFSESPPNFLEKILIEFQNEGKGTVEKLASSLHLQLKMKDYIDENSWINPKMLKYVSFNDGLDRDNQVSYLEFDLHFKKPKYNKFIQQKILTFVRPKNVNAACGILGAKMILINLRNRLYDKRIPFKICEIKHFDGPALNLN